MNEHDAANQHPRLRQAVQRFGHPAFLVGALGLWWGVGRGDGAALLAAGITLLLMEWLERAIPAKAAWRLTFRARMGLVGWYVAILVVTGFVLAVYEAVIAPLLAGVRGSIGIGAGLGSWPLLVQVLALFFASDFVYYWIHRAIHRYGWLWRLSGHGTHHAFQNLHALNVNATHPLETLLLSLPLVLVGGLSAAPAEAVSGALVLLVVNATLAHANLRMDTPVINWLFTSSNQHRRHHSRVFEHSNSNYACNAILWDRLFGTYRVGDVEQTGIGLRQLSTRDLLWLPWREPEDADTVASRSSVHSEA